MQDRRSGAGNLIRLATWNLENLGERHGAAPLDARRRALRPPLDALAADILCLQEVDSAKHGGGRDLTPLDQLLDGSRYQGFHRAVSDRPGGRGPADIHNLVILSRFDIEAVDSIYHRYVARQHLVLPTFGAIEIGFDRPILHARIGLPCGRSLHVLNVHLRAPLAALAPAMRRRAEGYRTAALWAEGYLVSALKRTAQALELRHLLDRLLQRDPQALVAVCGDFNARPVEMPVRIAAAATADTETPALGSSALVPLADRLPAVRRHSVRYGGEAVLVDHILASEALASCCRDLAIANEDLIEEAEAERLGPAFAGSTHAALTATFAIDQVA